MKLSVVTPLWQDKPPAENVEVAKLADELGFEELWLGEMVTYDAFALATAVGLQTQRIKLTIGPLAVSVRTPMTMAMGVASVAELTGRCTQLALGASSTLVVEAWHGRQWQKTAKHLKETASIVRSLLNGEKTNHAGELASSRGYHLRLEPTHSSITLAAFGPKAVKAAAQHGDRMLLNMVTPASLRFLKQQLTDEAKRLNRPTPPVAVWLCCALNPTEEAYMQLRQAIVGYLAAPGYSQMMSAAGFEDLVAYAKTRPHPRDLLNAIPNALIDAVALMGSSADIDHRIEEYRQAGADEICLVPATGGDPYGKKTLTEMAHKRIALAL